MDALSPGNSALAANITRAASKQTYYTIRLLVDKDRVADAYRAYAYFRWVDDCIDQAAGTRQERQAFLLRQQSLIDACYHGESPTGLAPEEALLVALVRRDGDQHSGLHAYIRSMMSVMAFDADRRGRLISRQELTSYTEWLATAVTEAMHYFIGHCCASPQDETRYQAVIGAHITHMLRDARDDAAMGYYNLPREVASARGISPWDFESPAYRAWVKECVLEARACFKTGREYLSRVENLRCRIAGYAYIRRFELVLDCIQRERYVLRSQYPERKSLRSRLEMIGWAIYMALRERRPSPASSAIPVR